MKDNLQLPFEQVADVGNGHKKPMTKRDGARAGARLRDHGMTVATLWRDELLFAQEAAFLRALLASPDGTATTDDVGDIAGKYADGGKWRGSIPKRLATMGIIEAVGAVKSVRPARHRGLVTRWKLCDRDKAEARLAWLERILSALAGEG
ncbi:MAG: hypothetical protein WEB58_10945 [Planctomycetaceae bacterium]